MATPVTPVPGLTSVVASGGVAVFAVGPAPKGGLIVNPLLPSEQGLVTAEDLFVNPVTSAGLAGNGTTFRLPPGASWDIIPGQTTETSVNAASNGHTFSVISY